MKMRFLMLFTAFFLLLHQSRAQTPRVIKGSVTDESGRALAGVSVTVKNEVLATATDSSGNFSIQVTSPGQILVFSNVGYIAQEIAAGEQKDIRVTLAEDVRSLQSVVVVGFGVQKKINLTGAVSSVSGSAIARQSTLQTSSALQGLAPGVTVTRSGGLPGSGSSIRIRGIGSIGDAGKLNPLVLVDGVESNIDAINPNDIQNISILKDAASAAIYGSRAAGGVILITTKRAGNKFEVNYNTAVSWQKPTLLPELVDGLAYMEMTNVAYANEGRTPFFTPAMLQAYRDSTTINPDKFPNTDWNDAMYHTALQQSHFISVNAGSERARVLASMGYISQDGIMNNSAFKQYNFRVNTNLKATKQLEFNFDIAARQSNYTRPSYDAATASRDVLLTPPIYAPVYSDGRLGASSNGRNPVALVDAGGTSVQKVYNALINFTTTYKPIRNLTLAFTAAPNFTFSNTDEMVLPVSLYEYASQTVSFIRPAGVNVSSLATTSATTLNMLLKGLATYTQSFGKHNLTVLGGFEQIENTVKNLSGFRDNFPLPAYQVLDAASSTNQRANGNVTDWALRSFFGRVNYDYDGRYLLEGNVRYDGSSRLAPGNKWNVFPSVSAGWRISEEKFMSDIDFISNLKLRASWGQMGNQNIGLYPFASTVDLTQFVILGNTRADAAALTSLANRGIGWETTEMKNVALEAGLFSNKLTVEAEYFVKDSRDILLSLPVPSTIGLAAPVQNAGKVRNKGYEFNVTYNGVIRDFSYNIGLNYSIISNEVLDLKGSGPYINGNTITQVGHPINSLYMYRAERLFQQDDNIASLPTQIGIYGPGDIKYADVSGPEGKPDGKITAEDRVIFDNSTFPKNTFAFNLGAKYKNFDFNLFLQGVSGVQKLLTTYASSAFYEFGTPQKWMLDYWTPENPGASYPRLTSTYTNNSQVSSYFLRNASYLRVKNVQLGYNLPLKSGGVINSLRIFVAGQDILTFSKFFDGWDPEAEQTNGTVYPFVSNYTIGLNVRF